MCVVNDVLVSAQTVTVTTATVSVSSVRVAVEGVVGVPGVSVSVAVAAVAVAGRTVAVPVAEGSTSLAYRVGYAIHAHRKALSHVRQRERCQAVTSAVTGSDDTEEC